MRKTATFLACLLTLFTLEAAVPHIDFSTLPSWMNGKFYRTIWDHNRFNVWVGGAGSGKSVGCDQRDVYRMTAEPGHNYLVVRKVGESNRYSTYAGICRWIYTWHLDSLYHINDTQMHIVNKYNGNEMIFAGMNDAKARERMKSTTFRSGPLTDVRIEEASECAEEDIDHLNLRLRGTASQPFQMTLTFNPISVDHYLKKKFFDSPRQNCTLLHSTYLDNRFIDNDYRAELESYRIVNPTFYQVYALGEWGQVGDTAFPNVIYEPCPYRIEDFDQVLWGQDFGYNHFNAIEGIGVKDGELYSFAELYVRQMLNSKVIEANDREKVLPRFSRCMCDSASPQAIAEWQDAGFYVEGVNKSGRKDFVRTGYQYLREARWHIDPVRCPGLAAEVRGATYRKDRMGNLTEEIVSFHDDALAACRYAVDEQIGQSGSCAVGVLTRF